MNLWDLSSCCCVHGKMAGRLAATEASFWYPDVTVSSQEHHSCDVTEWYHCEVSVILPVDLTVISPWCHKYDVTCMRSWWAHQYDLIKEWYDELTMISQWPHSCEITELYHCEVSVSFLVWPHSDLIMMSQIWCHGVRSLWVHYDFIQWGHNVRSLWAHCELVGLTSQKKALVRSQCVIIVRPSWAHHLISQKMSSGWCHCDILCYDITVWEFCDVTVTMTLSHLLTG